MAHDKLTPEQDRQRDQGHFNLYGMRDDARGRGEVDGENPGDGEGPGASEPVVTNPRTPTARRKTRCMSIPPARSLPSMPPARHAAWALTTGAMRTRNPGCPHARVRR